MSKPMHISKMASNRLIYINNNMFICVLISLLLPTTPESVTRVFADRQNISNDDGGRRLTREYDLRQGALRGLIVKPNRHYDLQSVEMFLGIPYAAPPVGNFRFMPPASAPSWSRVMMATDFAPVCPQTLPAKEKGDPQSLGRQRYMARLEPFLAHESEDCLYLNIYVPYREQKPKKFPVLVFIHGDSFEWSSGNPYDGKILASYGNIMVITFNYRLGILGFMKPSMTEYVYNNNGLLDQLAALQWIKDNIEDLNGDPNSVTLMGHGTGAACVSFLMLSPITNGLFHRAILMSGSALSDWAMTKDPPQSTSQVAQGLGCNPTSINLMSCLQNKSLADIQKIQILAREFETPLGAVVAGSFIPDKPFKIMASYPNLLSKYQLLCGVTEFESYHDFGAIELEHGILDTQRDEFIAKYADLLYEGAGDVALKEILKQYSPSKLDPQRWNVETNRDVILSLFSDARTLAPLVNFANYHSKANRQSYFYVFGHNSISTHYAALNKSVHGEELPYVFGVPLGGCNTHLHSEYTPKEKLLSEAIMRLWTNFVKIGTPNTQSVNEYFTLDRRQWNQYNVEWPEYNVDHQSYLKLDIPPHISSFYRSNYTKFWNDVMPTKMRRFLHDPLYEFLSLPISHKPKATHKVQDPIKNEIRTPHIINTPRSNIPAYGRVRPYYQPHHPTDNNSNNREIQFFKQSYDSQAMENINVYSATAKPKSNDKRVQAKTSGFTITLVASLGFLFLAVNVGICATICLKKRRTNSLRVVQTSNTTRAEIGEVDVIGRKSFNDDKNALKTLKDSCSVIKLMSLKKIRGTSQTCKKNQVSCKTPKSDDSGGFRERFQLRRHLSTSTLDAHTKVRDWIANEVMHRCSPNIIRKSNSELDNTQQLSTTTKPFTRSEEILSESKSLRMYRLKTNDNYLIKEPHSDFSIKYSKNKVESSENNSNIGSHSTTSSNKKTYNTSLVKDTGKSSDSLKSKDSHSLKSRTVSIAIDATPSARTNSILQQEPIELTKSVENQNYSRDENTIQCNEGKIKETLNKKNYDVFTNEITFSVKNETKPLNVYHTHSTSDPVTNMNCNYLRKSNESSNIFLNKVLPPVTFRNDINVTSKEDDVDDRLTTIDALLTIKRRNFPKVLPDLPQSQKRFSLQPTALQTFCSYTGSIKNELEHPKIPPVPPPRTSTIDRQMTFQYSKPLSSFEAASYPLDYENIEKLSLATHECLHTFKMVDNCTTPIKREYPKVIIASSNFSSSQMPTYITPRSPSQISLVSKVPRVTLPHDFHSHDHDFSPEFASVFSDDEITDFSGNVEEDQLIQELVGGIDALTHREDLLDSKGPANFFENKLEIVPVKVNDCYTLSKIKEDYVGTTDLQLPDISGFEKTAQIKPNYGINKLKQRSESIHRPPEKTVKLIQKGFMKPSVIINRGITNVVKSNHKKKNDTIELEHSNSGSSNDTEASTETVKESDFTTKKI